MFYFTLWRFPNIDWFRGLPRELVSKLVWTLNVKQLELFYHLLFTLSYLNIYNSTKSSLQKSINVSIKVIIKGHIKVLKIHKLYMVNLFCIFSASFLFTVSVFICWFPILNFLFTYLSFLLLCSKLSAHGFPNKCQQKNLI